MGTWSASVLGNDTSREVYEVFFEQYDAGVTLEAINAMIETRFAVSLATAEDVHNVLFALALAHWEVGALSASTSAQVRAAVEGGAALLAYRSLGADPAMLRERSKALTKLLQKLAVPRPSARKRKKPPVPLQTKLEPGACLSFRRSPKEYGGMVIVESAFFARRGNMCVAATNLSQANAPTFRDFADAKLVGFQWEEVSGQAARYASPNGKTGRIDTFSLGYDGGSPARTAFFERADRFFDVVGRFPMFTQVLLGSGSHSFGTDDAALVKALDGHRAFHKECVSREPLEALAKLLTTPKR